MKAVPFIDFPNLDDIERYKETIPCYDKMISIIQTEMKKGNVVVHIGDAGCMPSETIVIVDFAYEPRGVYEEIKVCKNSSAHPYKYLIAGDRKGDTELVFGAWKHRMKKEMSAEVQRRLEEGIY